MSMSIVAIRIDLEARVKADDDGRRENIGSIQVNLTSYGSCRSMNIQDFIANRQCP
jgi:hypothetical protein